MLRRWPRLLVFHALMKIATDTELYVAKMAEIAGLPRTYENSH